MTATTTPTTYTNGIGRTFTVQPADPTCEHCSGSGTAEYFGGPCVCTLVELAQASSNRRIYAHGVTAPAARSQHGEGSGTGARQDGPTDKQVAFFTRLLAEKAPAETHAALLAGFMASTRRQASASIDKAMAMPRLPRETAPAATPAPARTSSGLDLSSIPSGRYAVPGSDSRLKVQIDVVATGKWAGWVFVKDAAEYGQQRKYGSQRPGQAYSGQIVAELTAILADPMAASAAYGHLTSTCGVCGRHLEDAESVARGIGPVCAGKF